MDNLNVVELLMGIKEDVSAIKMDMSNFKESQRTEKEATSKEIQAIKAELKSDIDSINDSLQKRINSVQTVQNALVGELDVLKHAKDKDYSNKWKTTTGFIFTSLGSMLLVKLPDIIKYFLQ